MEHIKKYWYWYALAVFAIIIIMNWKKWFISNSITVKNVDWNKKQAIVDLRSGNIGGEETVYPNAIDSVIPTTNGFIHSTGWQGNKLLLIIYKEKSGGGIGDIVRSTIVDFDTQKVNNIK